MHSLVKRIQHHVIKFNLILLLSAGSLATASQAYAEDIQQANASQNNVAPVSEEQTLHTNLVLTALKADFFNKRCRGISVAKSFNKVNRLFITKYSLTANNYIKTFINTDVKSEKLIQEREFKKSLNKIGGCKKAKQMNWRKEINKEFNQLFKNAERSTWFPEEL